MDDACWPIWAGNGSSDVIQCHNEIHKGCEKESTNCTMSCKWGESRWKQIADIDKLPFDFSGNCQNLCCCFVGGDRAEHHRPDLKFSCSFSSTILFPIAQQEKLDTEFIVRSPNMKCAVTATYCESEFMPSRGLTIFQIIQLLTTRKIINLYDETKTLSVERQTLVRNAISYLLEREYPLEYAEIEMRTVTSTEDFRVRIREKLSPNRKFSLEDLSKRLVEKTLILMFNNCEDYMNQNFESFV